MKKDLKQKLKSKRRSVRKIKNAITIDPAIGIPTSLINNNKSSIRDYLCCLFTIHTKKGLFRVPSNCLSFRFYNCECISLITDALVPDLLILSPFLSANSTNCTLVSFLSSALETIPLLLASATGAGAGAGVETVDVTVSFPLLLL